MTNSYELSLPQHWLSQTNQCGSEYTARIFCDSIRSYAPNVREGTTLCQNVKNIKNHVHVCEHATIYSM